MKLPIEITPCPIVSVVLEIKFIPKENIIPEAVFGIIYNSIKDKYKNYRPLPILNIPEYIRKNDLSLKFNPHYQLQNDNIILQLGPNVILITSEKYISWDLFFKEICSFFNELKNINILSSVIRIGLRYINFFENQNIFDNIHLDVNFASKKLNSKIVFRTDIENDNYLNIVQIADNIILNNKKGSIIDIDTNTNNELTENIFFEKYIEIIQEFHLSEKKIFFELLKEEFLIKLNPIYLEE